jgi:membrane-associated phospholipid phosphatase
MTKERYEKIASWFSARPLLLTLLKLLNAVLPGVMYVAYPLLLVYLAWTRDGRFLRTVLVPAAVFVLVTLLRKLLDFPRPYEKLAITPVLKREGAGQSFPSRHAASAAVIAAAFWYIWMPAGLVMSLIAVLIAVIRPLGGIHFPRDTAAGVLFGLAVAIAGFLLPG